MLKVLIIEDEPLAARRLQHLLNEIDPSIEVLAVIDTVSASVEWLKSQEADLLFLDIHLADGDSFAIFDQVEVNSPIIFATAYDQYAIRAFKLNSIDYLLKPIEKEELKASLTKYKSQNPPQPSGFDIQALLQSLQPNTQPFQQRFMVSSGEKIKSIKIEDVAYFFGQKKYVFLTTRDNRKHIVNYTLGTLETLLDPNQFFRINRQFIISFDAIQHMYPYSKSRIRIDLAPKPEIEAIVSIDKARHFKNWLDR
ncbi:MAG: LytTR family DNA-binding domain-containing protein [Bacteroidota bacterium]